jgi:hypothetical protein
MSFRPEHEIYRRRLSRNVGVGVVLGCFVALVFALTVVKVKNGDMMHANDAPGLLGSTQPIVPSAPKVTP